MYLQLSAQKVTPGMFLQAVVESKEEKGYFLQLGFKDQARGFLKFPEGKDRLDVGQLVQVTVVQSTSKLVKCQLASGQCVQST
jgi:hypothetical protein